MELGQRIALFVEDRNFQWQSENIKDEQDKSSMTLCRVLRRCVKLQRHQKFSLSSIVMKHKWRTLKEQWQWKWQRSSAKTETVFVGKATATCATYLIERRKLRKIDGPPSFNIKETVRKLLWKKEMHCRSRLFTDHVEEEEEEDVLRVQ